MKKAQETTSGYSVTTAHILNYLIKYSSETRPASIMEMISYFEQKKNYFQDTKDWFDLSDKYDKIDDILINDQKVFVNPENDTINSAIRRTIKKYYMKQLPNGITLCALLSEEDKDIEDISRIENTKQVFYAKRFFDETSINLMRDALEVFPYAEEGKTREIIHNLNKLTPYYNRREYDPDRVSAVKYPGTYYQNLDEINKAFRTVKVSVEKRIIPEERKMMRSEYNKKYSKTVRQISFKYCEYDDTKKLRVKKLRNGKETRIVNPVKVMWSNGYYYLVAAVPDFKNEDEFIFINYRIDRMTDVKCCKTPSKYQLQYDAETDKEKHPEAYPQLYAKKNPVMYSENIPNQKSIVLLCDRSLINNAIDTFGFDIVISKANDPKKVEITLRKTSYTGVKMWALEYNHGCEVIAPAELRDQMKASAEHLMKMYNDQP